MHPSVTILRSPQVHPDVLYRFLNKNAAKIGVQHVSIVSAYTACGELFQIGNLIPFAQAVHETGHFTSERWLKSYNPAGIGATNDGAWGSNFNSVAEGVFAQYCHLLAYALPISQASFLQHSLIKLDPRLANLITQRWQGIAPTWEGLNGRWAFPGKGYAQAIMKIAARIDVPRT